MEQAKRLPEVQEVHNKHRNNGNLYRGAEARREMCGTQFLLRLFSHRFPDEGPREQENAGQAEDAA
jgi:hypothetical protein